MRPLARNACPDSFHSSDRVIFQVAPHHFLSRLLLLTALVATLALPATARSENGIEIQRAELEYSDNTYRLALAFSFDLTHTLEDALSRGVPLYFTTEVHLTRPRWWWFDERALIASRTTRVSYNVLTQKYHVSQDGSLRQSFTTLDEALSLVRRPPRWDLGPRDMLKSGSNYNFAVRTGLDVARLPKPIQVHALNSSDWRFTSDWKQFTFRAE